MTIGPLSPRHAVVVDGRDRLQTWRVVANILEKQSGTADEGGLKDCGLEWGS